MENNEMSSARSKGGRKPKKNPAIYCCMVRFNEVEWAEFLRLFELSGMQVKAHFAFSRIFNEEFKVLHINKNLVDYYTKLSTLHAQFRRIGVNYNQVVKELHSNFSEKKALALLYKLEKQTLELVETNQQIVLLTHKFADKLNVTERNNDSKD